MNLMQEIIEKAKKNPNKIVFPESEDRRILKACKIIKTKKIAIPILFKKGSLDERVNQGLLMVKNNEAHGLISGAVETTKELLLKSFKIIGTKPNIKRVSGVMILLTKKPILFADVAVQIDPTQKQLAEIAILTAETAKFLGLKPRIAMLSFSTKGSASHELVDKVINATKIAKRLRPDLVIDGELQADVALVKEVAKIKSPKSIIKGDANVLIFPDLNSANISYKLVNRLGNIEAIGPILQGLNKPVNDLSRGCSVQDIVYLTAITSLQK